MHDVSPCYAYYGDRIYRVVFAKCDVCYCVGEGYSVLFRNVVKKGREAVF